MRITTTSIQENNLLYHRDHQRRLAFLTENLSAANINVEELLEKIGDFQIAIPSWALGTGGTRFGRFPGGGEPANLEQKMEDVAVIHALSQAAGAISLHIPWDIPENPGHIRSLAKELGLRFDAVNSNTFQDQPEQKHSYKFGSLCHTDSAVRQQAVEHNIEVIRYGEALGSTATTVWLSDGSTFPGQLNFRGAFERTYHSLEEIYKELPDDWKMYVEYKPYEPNFYSMVVQDWGTSFLFANKLGKKAFTLVDLGHHLPNTNIEQIVATLMMEGKLGGFHFNDSKYGDDDLTVGSIKPYQLFLIFNELVEGMEDPASQNPPLAWMIDASHNVKDPLEDLMQSVEAIRLAYAQALVTDREALSFAQQTNDPVMAQEVLQHAFRTDLRPLLAEARLRAGGAISPIGSFRELKIRKKLIAERGHKTIATGL